MASRPILPHCPHGAKTCTAPLAVLQKVQEFRHVLLQGSQGLDSRVLNLAMTFIPTGENSGQVAQLEHQAQAYSPVDPASEMQAKEPNPPKLMQVGCPAAGVWQYCNGADWTQQPPHVEQIDLISLLVWLVSLPLCVQRQLACQAGPE